MAVLLDLEWGGAFYDKFSLHPHSDDDDARMRRLLRYLEEKNKEAVFEMVAQGKHVFQSRFIERPVPDEMVAQNLTLNRGTALPDYVHAFFHGKLVSSKLHDAIVDSKSASDGFNLHPINIYFPDGRKYPDQYYFWDVYRKVDAIDPDCKYIKTVAGEPDGNHFWTLKSAKSPLTREHLSVRKDIMADLAAWRDVRHHDDYVFISDALHQLMQDRNMTGFSARTEWSER